MNSIKHYTLTIATEDLLINWLKLNWVVGGGVGGSTPPHLRKVQFNIILSIKLVKPEYRESGT